MNNVFILYADTDASGNITTAYQGVNIIPDRQYQYYFFLGERTESLDVSDYAVVSGELMRKEV